MSYPNQAQLDLEREGEDQINRATRPFVALVVDDSPSQRKMLKLLLKKWKFEVIEAEDGMQALGICQSREIDFVWSSSSSTVASRCSCLAWIGSSSSIASR